MSPTEIYIEDDYNSMWAMSRMGTETAKFDDYSNNQFNVTLTGETFWMATRSKYFAAILVPQSRPGSGASATGLKEKINSWRKEFKIAMFLSGCSQVKSLKKVKYYYH